MPPPPPLRPVIVVVLLLMMLFVLVLFLLRRSAIARFAPDDGVRWSWANAKGILTLRSSLGYRFEIGAGGCLWRVFRDGSNASMIGPPTQHGEQHDRVLQMVIWATETRASGVAGLSPDDSRFNPNQGGGWSEKGFGRGNALYSPIIAVELDRATNALKVWSTIRDQFQPKLANHFSCDFPLLTVYTPHPTGALLIDRFVHIGPCAEQGRPIPVLRGVYIEQWMTSPMSLFSQVSYPVEGGAGTRMVPVETLPDYPSVPAERTGGSLVAHGRGDAMALMWARAAPNVLNSRSYLEYHKLFALMPAANLGDVGQGSTIRMSMAIAFAPDADLAVVDGIVRQVQPLVPKTEVLLSATAAGPAAAADLQRLRGNVGRAGTRTLLLGGLLPGR